MQVWNMCIYCRRDVHESSSCSRRTTGRITKQGENRAVLGVPWLFPPRIYTVPTDSRIPLSVLATTCVSRRETPRTLGKRKLVHRSYEDFLTFDQRHFARLSKFSNSHNKAYILKLHLTPWHNSDKFTLNYHTSSSHIKMHFDQLLHR